MNVYFALIIYIIALVFICHLNLKNAKRIYLILTIGFLGFLSAVRGSSVGNDTVEYLKIFSECQYYDLSLLGMRYEFGYVLLNKMLFLISDNPQIILIVSSIIIGIGFYKFIYKYSMIPMLSVFLFFSLGYWGQMMNTIRQSIALVILLYAFDFIKKRKLLPFIGIVCVASLFHKTAIVFLVAYPLSFFKVKIKAVFKALIIAISGYIFLESILNTVLVVFPSYNYYLDSIYLNGNIRLATIMNIMVVCSIFYFGRILNKYLIKNELASNSQTNKLLDSCNFDQKEFEMISLFLLASIVISIISLKFNLLDRVGVYFDVFSIIYIPNIVARIKDKNLLLFTTTVVLLMFFLYAKTIQIFIPELNLFYPY